MTRWKDAVSCVLGVRPPPLMTALLTPRPPKIDTTTTRSDPQRVRMSSGERPIGAAKGKQPNNPNPNLIPRPCANPPPPQKKIAPRAALQPLLVAFQALLVAFQTLWRSRHTGVRQLFCWALWMALPLPTASGALLQVHSGRIEGAIHAERPVHTVHQGICV